MIMIKETVQDPKFIIGKETKIKGEQRDGETAVRYETWNH